MAIDDGGTRPVTRVTGSGRLGRKQLGRNILARTNLAYGGDDNLPSWRGAPEVRAGGRGEGSPNRHILAVQFTTTNRQRTDAQESG